MADEANATIDVPFLESRGFEVTRFPVDSSAWLDIANNPFLVMDPYPRWDFYFVKYPDQRVRVTGNGTSGLVFGRCQMGYFLEDAEGVIRIILGPPEEESRYWRYYRYEDLTFPDLAPVNQDLTRFRACYLEFLAGLYSSKAAGVKQPDNWLAVTQAVEARLAETLREIDGTFVTDDSFWGIVLYMLSDDLFPRGVGISDYSADGRFQLNNQTV